MSVIVGVKTLDWREGYVRPKLGAESLFFGIRLRFIRSAGLGGVYRLLPGC